MTFESLLPPGATHVERAIEQAMARVADVPVPLRRISDPARTPEEFLPFLAWGRSTDLWDRDWPTEKKRAVTQAWFRLHRRKGTLAGIDDALRFFGAFVAEARVPPDGTYPDPALTREERDRFLARFRQIRLFRFRTRGQAAFGAYVGSGVRRAGLFAAAGFHPAFTDAPVRIGRRAFVFDPLTGEETPVRRAERVVTTELRGAVDFERIFVPGQVGPGFFPGQAPRARVFMVASTARARVYSIAVDRDYLETRSTLHISGILPAAQPIDVRPRRVRLRNCACRLGSMFPGAGSGRRAFIGRQGDGKHRTFLPRTTAPLRIFDQIFLFDPDRLPDQRSGRTFVGRTRLGMPAYHARLTLDARGRASPFAFSQFARGFVMRTSKRKLRQAIEAIRLSKALRDKLRVTAKTMRPARVADGVPLGTIKVSAWVRDVRGQS